jgi:hypothetical protein
VTAKLIEDWHTKHTFDAGSSSSTSVSPYDEVAIPKRPEGL